MTVATEALQANGATDGRGSLRTKAEAVDTTVLASPLTFEFSGRTAKNRFLKAPMTERLCSWSGPNNDIVRHYTLESARPMFFSRYG